MSAEQVAELEVKLAMLRSSLASTRDIVEACRSVIVHPETISEEQRQIVVEVLGATLNNINDLLEKVPVDPALAQSSTDPQPSV